MFSERFAVRSVRIVAGIDQLESEDQ